MNEYGCSVLVKDNTGNEFICEFDSLCSLDEHGDVLSTMDSNRQVPTRMEELSEYERRSCRSSVLVL